MIEVYSQEVSFNYLTILQRTYNWEKIRLEHPSCDVIWRVFVENRCVTSNDVDRLTIRRVNVSLDESKESRSIINRSHLLSYSSWPTRSTKIGQITMRKYYRG